MRTLKVIALVSLMVLCTGAFSALYVEGRIVYEILNPHTH